MRIALLLVLIVMIGGCRTTSQVNTVRLVSENKDVFILATFIQDHLRNTGGRNLDMNELMRRDTSGRITNNFESIELKPRGGHIAVKFKFSSSRDKNKIELNAEEIVAIKKLRWVVKASKDQNDGKIQFDYGERFYRIIKIVIK